MKNNKVTLQTGKETTEEDKARVLRSKLRVNGASSTAKGSRLILDSVDLPIGVVVVRAQAWIEV